MADWTCPNCNWTNRDFVDICGSCGAARYQVATADPTTATAGPALSGFPAPATPEGATVFVPAAPPQPLDAGGVLGGLAAGAIAAVLGTAIWYGVVAFTETQFAFVAIAVGWLVGTAVVLGARGRGSILLVAASVLFTLGALVVSEYLILYHLTTSQLGIRFDLIQPLDFMLEVVVESISADPVTLLFWGAALLAAAYIPFQKMRQPTP